RTSESKQGYKVLGSPYQKSSISWKGGRSLGLVPGFVLAGNWSVPLSGTRGPGSSLVAGGNDTGFAPYCSISSSNSGNNMCTQVNRGLCSIGLSVLGSTQAGAHSEPRPFQSPFLLLQRFLAISTSQFGSSFHMPFLPTLSVSEMKAESGLSPDSSSIGSRVGSSKVKDAVAPSVSMDSSDSSMDLTAEVEDPKAIVARNVSPVAEGNRYPPIGPPSVIGVEEVADWRMKYNLPADVIIRVPGPKDRVSDFGFLYTRVTSSRVQGSSPFFGGQDIGNHGDFPRSIEPSGLENFDSLAKFGDLQGLVIEVAEVLYYLRPRRNEPPVTEVPKRERKRLPAFAGNWTEKFAFMRLPGFLPIWQLEDLPRVDYSSGRETIERVLRLPIERRQIHFLVSKAALKGCSIWGEMSGSKGDETLAEYKKALQVMSARKSAPKRAASVDDDEVQFLRSRKRLTVVATAPSSSKKKSKASALLLLHLMIGPQCLPTLTRRYFLRLQCSWRQRKIPPWQFSRSRVTCFRSDGQVASQLFHLGERMLGAASTKAEMDALASQLRKEKDVALAKDNEIKALRRGTRRKQENWQQRRMGQLKNMEEELNDLKDTAETFEAEKAMAVNGAKLMREWLNGQTDSWDHVNVLEQYKMVKIIEAELLGLPTPSFEGEPSLATWRQRRRRIPLLMTLLPADSNLYPLNS
ncbi:LOW QUALITY PROTEIN: hypothetical protein HID58_074459, partial [Brassica napus]